MTINEIEASSVLNLIDAFTEFKKGGALIHFLEACKKTELINEYGQFNSSDFRKLRAHRKKMAEVIRKSEEIKNTDGASGQTGT